MQANILRMRGVIRRDSGLPKLRKPIFAFLYSRLLTWVNTIDEGLNPPRSFNLVSAARNRPSWDPNCELFPQGPIIPVISLVAFPWGEAETVPGGTRQHQNASSEASSRYFRSMAQVLPYRHSSCTQFSAPSQTECHRMMRRCVSSSTGTKLGQLQKTHFKLKALSFRFIPKGTADAPCKLNSTENARFETRPLLSAQATSCNRSRINAGGLQAVRKTAGHKFQPLIAKGNRVRWLSHEFFHDRHGN